MATTPQTPGAETTQKVTLAKALNMGLRKAMPDPQP